MEYCLWYCSRSFLFTQSKNYSQRFKRKQYFSKITNFLETNNKKILTIYQITENNEIKISDFGTTRYFPSKETIKNSDMTMNVGTTYYMAPGLLK